MSRRRFTGVRDSRRGESPLCSEGCEIDSACCRELVGIETVCRAWRYRTLCDYSRDYTGGRGDCPIERADASGRGVFQEHQILKHHIPGALQSSADAGGEGVGAHGRVTEGTDATGPIPNVGKRWDTVVMFEDQVCDIWVERPRLHSATDPAAITGSGQIYSGVLRVRRRSCRRD